MGYLIEGKNIDRGGMMDSIKITKIFRHLFDAAADFEKWPVFLENLADLFNARGANLMYFDYAENKLTFTVQNGFEHVPLAILERASELFAEDPRISFARRHAGMPVTCRQSVDEATLHASRVYKEFLKPAGVEYSLGVHFMDETTGAALSVMRGPNDEPFNQSDSDLFGEIIPSVKRAIELHKRLAVLDFEKRAAFEAFDSMPMGLVLIEEKGRVLFANRTACEISENDDGFKLGNDRMFIHMPNEGEEIFDYIRRAIRSARQQEILSAEGLAVTRPSGERSYELVMMPVWGNHLRYGLGNLDDPVVVILITDPDRPQEAPSELLQRLFGLTPAESRVVEWLVAGSSVAEIAEELHLSQHTIREHLSVAFEKTGTERQGQLIKRIMSTPVWVTAQEQRNRYMETRASRKHLSGG